MLAQLGEGTIRLRYLPPPAHPQEDPMEFTSGLPETRCGLGSTLAFTEQLRPQLSSLLRSLEVNTIVDAPCGDFNWMSRVDLSGVRYFGIDYDRQHCLDATRLSEPQHFAPRSKTILELDIVDHALPAGDLVLCRDFVQHLPNEMIHKFLYNFWRSGNRWLLITNHEGWDDPDIQSPGGFHRVDLTKPPFNLPQPMDWIADGERRYLALWQRDQIRGPKP